MSVCGQGGATGGNAAAAAICAISPSRRLSPDGHPEPCHQPCRPEPPEHRPNDAEPAEMAPQPRESRQRRVLVCGVRGGEEGMQGPGR